MRSRLAFAVFALAVIGYAVVALLRERARYLVPPPVTLERDAGAAPPSAPELAPEELPAPAPRSRGLDPLWPGAVPPPQGDKMPTSPPDLPPVEDLTPPPPVPGERPAEEEHYLSRVLGAVPDALPRQAGRAVGG